MQDATYTIRLLGPDDAALLHAADPELFDSRVDDRWSAEFLVDPRLHIVAAIADGRVVGSVSGMHYVHPDHPPSLYIIEIAVAQAHQGRGVAKAMLDRMLAHGRALGCVNAWVGTEGDNVAACRLYASAGGQRDPEAFVTYSFALK